MSAKWRTANNRVQNRNSTPSELPVESAARDDVVLGWKLYDPTAQERAYYLGGNTPEVEANPLYPGPREYFHPEAAEFTPSKLKMDGQGNDTFNMIDREMDGLRGAVDDQPYSLGVVSSDLTENFWLGGQQAVIRRGRNPSEHGPVGTSDYSGRQALQYAMSVNQFFPNEASQADLVRAI